MANKAQYRAEINFPKINERGSLQTELLRVLKINVQGGAAIAPPAT